jgi:hypothetical protein
MIKTNPQNLVAMTENLNSGMTSNGFTEEHPP